MNSELTFNQFRKITYERGHNVESLSALFRGKIEEPREFFERVMSCKYHGADCSDVIIPYRSVIAFYQEEAHYFLDLNRKQKLCACGCRLPVFDRKKWATATCRKRAQRESVTD